MFGWDKPSVPKRKDSLFTLVEMRLCIVDIWLKSLNLSKHWKDCW